MISIVLALLLVLAAGLPAATAQEPKRGGALRVGLYDEPDGLDPTLAGDPIGIRVRNHVMERLVDLDADLAIKPMLARSWTVSPDGKTYTFALRPGVKFHNGDELTAEDVKWTYDLFLQRHARRADLSMVESISTPDRYTVVFKLKQATATFLPAIVQHHSGLIASKRAGEETLKTAKVIDRPVGTGPFRVVEWVKGQHIKVERFKDYVARPEPSSGLVGRRVAYVDEITWVFIKDDSARVIALEKGAVDYATLVPYLEIERLRKVSGVVVESVPSTTWSYVMFNFEKPVWRDLRMRQAVAHALNYEAMVQALYLGHGQTNNSLIPPAQKVWRTPVHERKHGHDLGRARQLLKEAGYKGEEVELLTYSAALPKDNAEVVQAQLQAAGLNLKLSLPDLSTALNGIYSWARFKRKPEWDMYILTPVLFRADPHQHYDTRVHSRQHPGRYANPKLDALIEEAAVTLDLEKRKQLYSEAQRIVMDDIPMIVLFCMNQVEAYRSHLRGVKVLDPFGERLWNVWIDKP